MIAAHQEIHAVAPKMHRTEADRYRRHIGNALLLFQFGGKGNGGCRNHPVHPHAGQGAGQLFEGKLLRYDRFIAVPTDVFQPMLYLVRVGAREGKSPQYADPLCRVRTGRFLCRTVFCSGQHQQRCRNAFLGAAASVCLKQADRHPFLPQYLLHTGRLHFQEPRHNGRQQAARNGPFLRQIPENDFRRRVFPRHHGTGSFKPRLDEAEGSFLFPGKREAFRAAARIEQHIIGIPALQQFGNAGEIGLDRRHRHKVPGIFFAGLR